MLYKFKSKADGDLIMLEPNGRQVLQIIGKDASPTGIITVAQIPGAISALETAVAKDEASRKSQKAEAAGDDKEGHAQVDSVGLSQRAKPFIDMLRRSQSESADVVWGV